MIFSCCSKGVGFALRQSAKLIKPKLIISENGGRWTLKSESTLKSGSYEFTPDMEFDETRLDGEQVKVSEGRFSDFSSDGFSSERLVNHPISKRSMGPHNA